MSFYRGGSECDQRPPVNDELFTISCKSSAGIRERHRDIDLNRIQR